MRKNIRVVPGSGRYGIKDKGGLMVVEVREPPENNRANIAVMRLLSKHFGKDVRIVSGFRSRRKVVEVAD